MRKRISLLPAIAALLVISAALVLFYGPSPGAEVQSPLVPPQDTPMQVVQPLDERLLHMDSLVTADMMVYWVTHFTHCGHEQVRRATPAPEEVGMTLRQFAEYHPGFTMTLNGATAHMRRDVEQYCTAHYILWYTQGQLGLYRNVNASQNLELVTRIKQSPEEFSEEFLTLAAQGIACDTLDQVEAILEDAET